MGIARDPETYRIADSAWENGWREQFGMAIDKALESYRDGEEVQIKEIWVKKRGDTSWHDYRIVL
jgi:bifunctional DNA-binding transcriptional regulator/antitoxin component of YhaV-PrlF toxin-antitoxin module